MKSASKKNRLDRLVRSAVADFDVPEYPAAPNGALRLDANTNLLGPNPAVERVLRGPAPDLAQYATPFNERLLEALAKEHGLTASHFITGNGSDEVTDFVTKAFLNPGDRLAIATPTFVMYAFYGRMNLGRVVEVPLDGGFHLDLKRLTASRAKLTILASPNNPTGNAFAREALERLIRGSRGIFVVDEAYAQFCGQDFMSRVDEFENLVVIRTFSKAYGLAGIRVGYAAARPELMRRIYAVKPPYTVNEVSERIAVEALGERAFVKRAVETARRERKRMAEVVRRLGARPHPTDANFMLVDVHRPSGQVAGALAARGILVRNMSSFPRLEKCIRVTVGLPEHTDRFEEALREVLR